MKGRSGWVAMAKKDNIVVVGVESKGRMCMFKKDVEAVQHICSLVDLDEENDSLQVTAALALEAFNE